MGPVVAGRIVSQRGQRNVADRLALMVKDHAAGVSDFTDHREVQFPFMKDRLRHGFPSGLISRIDNMTCACGLRSEEHTSELQSLMRISYAVFCLNRNTPLKTTPV